MPYLMFKNKKYASTFRGKKWKLIADTKSKLTTNTVEFDCAKYDEILVVGYRTELTVNALASAVYPVDLYNQGGYTGLAVTDTSNLVVFYKDSDTTAHLYIMVPEIPLLNGCAIYAR